MNCKAVTNITSYVTAVNFQPTSDGRKFSTTNIRRPSMPASVHCMDLQISTRRRPRCTVWTYRYPHADGLGALYGPTYIHTQSASMHRKEIMLLRALQAINLLRRGGYFETLNPTSLSVSYSKNRKTQTKTARSMNCVSHFKGHSQNCEKRLLASSHLSVCPSSCPHGTNRLPLDGFSWNLSIFR